MINRDIAEAVRSVQLSCVLGIVVIYPTLKNARDFGLLRCGYPFSQYLRRYML